MKNPFTIIVEEIRAWLGSVLRWMPGRIGCKLRYWIYKIFLKNCGIKVFISAGCYIRDLKNISLGNNICIGMNTQIYAAGSGEEKIEIGSNVTLTSHIIVNADCGGYIKLSDNVIIGPNTVLRASNHK